MGTPSSNQYFEAIWTSDSPPTDPNLFTAAELVAGSFDSAAVSSATSKAVSTVNAAAPDSTSMSQARSQAVSAATMASTADSKAVSGSVVTSTADSKAVSVSGNASIADSKAVSVAVATPVVTAVVYSTNISTADSKAVSTAVVVGPPYGTYNTKAQGLVGDGVADDFAAFNLLVNTTMQPSGGQLDVVGVVRTAGSITIPQNVTLRFMDGAYLAPDIGIVVTINGRFMPPALRKIFGTAGTFSFAAATAQVLYVQYWGAKGDGVTDDLAAVQAAYNSAAATNVLIAPYNVNPYLMSGPLKLTIPGSKFLGEVNGFTYGLSPAGTRFKFTGAGKCFDTYINAGDATNQPYVTVENITIDGNNIGTIGFDGGYLSFLKNVTAVNCTTAGLRLGALSQTSTFVHCAFNGNLDGILAGATLSTMYFEDCVTRQNTRYGVNGSFPSSTFKNHISESNGSQGVNLTGDCDLLKFEGYFEQNDAANGAAGYNLRFACTGPGEGIEFENTVFGSTVSTKIANIVSGRLTFRNCSQSGDTNSLQMTLTDGVDVVCDNSFTNYLLPANVKIVTPLLRVNPLSALKFTDISDGVVVNSPALILGAGSFALSFVYEPNTGNFPVRGIVAANAAGLNISVAGSASGMTGIVFAVQGVAGFHTTNVILKANVPSHICYVRVANVGYIYVNGLLIESFADANNYSTSQTYVGNDGVSVGLQGRLFALTFFNVALTAQNVFDLWRTAGNPYMAQLTGMTLNFDFERRDSNSVFESVNKVWLPFGGANLAWLNSTNPTRPNVSLDKGDVSFTLTARIDPKIIRVAAALTANRTITLATLNAYDGAEFWIVRTGLGGFTLDVGGLKTIPSGTAATVQVAWDGIVGAWRLVGYQPL